MQLNMNINYVLIILSFLVPIIRLGFTKDIKGKVNPRIFIMEWVSSGALACLVQFLGIEITFISEHEMSITIATALFAKKIFTFADENVTPTLSNLLNKRNNSK